MRWRKFWRLFRKFPKTNPRTRRIIYDNIKIPVKIINYFFRQISTVIIYSRSIWDNRSSVRWITGWKSLEKTIMNLSPVNMHKCHSVHCWRQIGSRSRVSICETPAGFHLAQRSGFHSSSSISITIDMTELMCFDHVPKVKTRHIKSDLNICVVYWQIFYFIFMNHVSQNKRRCSGHVWKNKKKTITMILENLSYKK